MLIRVHIWIREINQTIAIFVADVRYYCVCSSVDFECLSHIMSLNRDVEGLFRYCVKWI